MVAREPTHYRINPLSIEVGDIEFNGRHIETLDIVADNGIYHVFISREDLRKLALQLTLALGNPNAR